MRYPKYFKDHEGDNLNDVEINRLVDDVIKKRLDCASTGNIIVVDMDGDILVCKILKYSVVAARVKE